MDVNMNPLPLHLNSIKCRFVFTAKYIKAVSEEYKESLVVLGHIVAMKDFLIDYNTSLRLLSLQIILCIVENT